MNTSKDNSKQYKLVMLLNSISDLERDILICLCHVYPKSISATQLARMIDVSIKARTLSRGVLKRLNESGYILLDKLTPKLYSIRINHEHEILSSLVKLCKEEGEALRQFFLKKINPDENTVEDD
ncbi:MAG: hypothetical protein ACFFCS_24430 [Candidatus Hodarchaeota archaeon]